MQQTIQQLQQQLQQAGIELQILGQALKDAEGDEAEMQRLLPRVSEPFELLCRMLSERILAWNWTDDRGRPLPEIGDDPAVFKCLRDEEVRYLIGLAQAEQPAERKNGSRPLPTTSSDTGLTPTQTPSGEGRSRTKGS